MRKILTYILITILLVGGFFYFTLDREDGDRKGPIEQEDPLADDSINEGENPVEDNSLNEEDPDGDQDLDQDENKHGPRKSRKTIEIGSKLPNFTLKNLEGEEKSLKDYEKEGKIIFLNFWASWCEPCRAEMPDLDRIERENDDLIVLGVNMEEKRSREKVEEFLAEGQYSFEILLDDELAVADDYGIVSLPTTFFLDRNGIFRGMRPGFMDYDYMEMVLEELREY